MDYTVWHDSSDPPVNMDHQNPSYLNEEAFNSSYEHDWNPMNYQHSHDVGSLDDVPTRNYYDGTFNEKWEDDFTNLGGDSYDDTTILSLAKNPIDPMTNVPIHGDNLDYSNANGSGSQAFEADASNTDISQKEQSQHLPSSHHKQPAQESEFSDRFPSHRRGFSDAHSMRVPLVEPSHHDDPAPNSLHRLDTSSIVNDEYGVDFFGENPELSADAHFPSSFSPNLTSNAFQTPNRVPGRAGGAGNRQSPTLARDSPGAYLGKGLESPMEFSGLESPYLSYQPFPVLPNQSVKASGKRKTASIGSTRTRRTSSSASQKSLSLGPAHDALEQPGTPHSHDAGTAASAHKPLATTNSNTPAPATTPRALAPNHDWDTPRADGGEHHGWNTPKLSESPLSTMASGPNGIIESMRTPSISRTPSSATPSMTPSVGKSAFGTPTFPATPSLVSPIQDGGTPQQGTPGGKEDSKASKSPSKGTPGTRKDGRRRIGRREIDILEDFFHKNPHPERSDRLYLSELTNLEQRTVQIWFQNRRAKTRALKMPPSRADTSDEANHYRAAAAAASNAAATALSKKRASPKSAKSKVKSGSSTGSASSLSSMGIDSPSVGNLDEKGSPFDNDPFQRSHSIASPLSSSRGSISARGKTARAPLLRSRSSTTSHGLSRSMSSVGYGYTGPESNALNLYMDGISGGGINNEQLWGGELSGYSQPRPHVNFQRTSSAGALSSNSSLGGLENIPENSAHNMKPNMQPWQGTNISPSSSNSAMPANSAGYHQQLPTNLSNPALGPHNAASQSTLQQRMQQLHRLQQLKQLKHKSHFSLGGGSTRDRSMSMFEHHSNFANDDIEADLGESSFNPTHPSRSGSITSLASIGSSAIPPSPQFESRGQHSPEGIARNTPDALSIPWGNAPPGPFMNEGWPPMDGAIPPGENWVSSYQQFPPMRQQPIYQQQHQRQQSMFQQQPQMNISGGNPVRNGLAASAAAAALKGSQHRNSTQPGLRSRQPSVRLQMDESSNSAQLVEFLPDDSSEHSPGRAEGAAKRLIGERVAASNDDPHPFLRNT